MADTVTNIEDRIKAAQDLHVCGRLTEAGSAYSAILQHAPNSVDALRLLGTLKLQQSIPQEAIVHLTQALHINPNLQDARLNLAYASFLLRRFDDALREIDAVLTLTPDSAIAHSHRGVILEGLQRHSEALEAFQRALALQPDNTDALINCGNLFHKSGEHEYAVACYQRAIKTAPTHALAHFSLGRALAAHGEPRAALHHYDQALATQPENAETRWAKGVTKLMLGDYLEGWALYEERWQSPSFGHAPRNFPRPQWDGSPISGKTILVHAEQGFGDTIQFCRYIPLLTAQGARVLLLAQPELHTLLQASLPCDVFAPGDKIPSFDVHCALLSLPHLMRTTLDTVPHATSYLTPPANKIAHWEKLLEPKQKLCVGLAWSGRRTHINDQRRSLTLETLRPLLDLNVEFHALQTEISDADQAALVQSNIRTFNLESRDFGDAAAHIAAMDIVISVDTSLAHLTGALGKPAWIMLAYTPDFRWMINRDDSPWYPTARLFRQKQRGDWADVIARVRAQLQTRL